MKSLLIISSLFLISVGACFAQDDGVVSKIVCYNGEILYGEIFNQNDSEIALKLNNTDDTIYLSRILIQSTKTLGNVMIFDDGYFHKKEGLIFSFRAGLGSDNGGGSLHPDFWLAMLFRPDLAFGMGLGIHAIDLPFPYLASANYTEIFLYGRYYLNDKRRRLFTDIKLGAGIDMSRRYLEHSSGPLFQSGLGIQFAKKKKTKLEVRLSHLFLKTSSEVVTGGGKFLFFGNETKIILSRPLFTIGLIF